MQVQVAVRQAFDYARKCAKTEALELMIQRVRMDDPLWKVVDLEEYTIDNPDTIINDQHIYDLAVAITHNNSIVALRIPEHESLVSWNALWPLFEAIKNSKSISRLFISSSGMVFGHSVSVFFGNSILGFFDSNFSIRTLGSYTNSESIKRPVRESLNRNIVHHYLPTKVLALRAVWSRYSANGGLLLESGSDALSLLFDLDEHLSLFRALCRSAGSRCPSLLERGENKRCCRRN
jgi:hypothetical protein